MRGKLIQALSFASESSALRSTKTLIFCSESTYRPVFMSALRIESPSAPTDAMTTFAFVPAGKLTTSVSGSIPSSTLRFVVAVVDCVGVLISDLPRFEEEAMVVLVVLTEEGGVTGTTRAIGTPITTTYTARNAPTKTRPYCI
jgi:hypothetical protein